MPKSIQKTFIKELVSNFPKEFGAEGKQSYKGWLEKNYSIVSAYERKSKKELLEKALIADWTFDELERGDIELDRLEGEVNEQRHEMHWLQERYISRLEPLAEKHVAKKVRFQGVKPLGDQKRMQKASSKKADLEDKARVIMGSDTGMKLAAIANEIERIHSKAGTEPPYSCTPDKNGKTSLMKILEPIIKKLREEIRSQRAAKIQA